MNSLRRLVTLGDSILSDCYPGPGLGAASLIANNADQRFPEFEGRDLTRLAPRAQFINHTRTGWMLPDLLEATGSLRPDREATVVLLSGGGNDLLHGLMEGRDAGQCLQEIEKNMVMVKKQLKDLYPDLTTLYCLLYDPTDLTGIVGSGRDYSAALPAFHELNSRSRRQFDEVLDLHTHFLGHGQRANDPNFEHHNPDDPSGWFKMDIEPNPRGASEIRRLFWNQLEI